MSWRHTVGVATVALVLVAGGGPHTGAQDRTLPAFEVDPSWPMLPDDWILGQVASVTVDARDHVWVLHRPRTVEEEQQANAAPPVLEFDAAGTFIRGWGGPGEGYEWPANEHGIHADPQGNIWVGGNSGQPESDDMLLKLTSTGELLLQIGRRGQSGGNADTRNLRRPAESFVYQATNEVFVADGYGNRRVIALDADTGAFKRMWGAFGNEPLDTPPDAPPDDERGPSQFGIVHGIEVSNDGLVYVADRNNSRIQVFTTAGAFTAQGFVNRNAASGSTVAGLAFSPDPEQRVHLRGGPGQLPHPCRRPRDARSAVFVRQRRGRAWTVSGAASHRHRRRRQYLHRGGAARPARAEVHVHGHGAGAVTVAARRRVPARRAT